jgi:ribonuclease D
MVSSIKDIKNYPVIGFDAEKKVSFEPFNNNGVAIVQISTDDTCYIFQIKYISDLEPLFELLEDRSVAKVGIGLHNDIKWFKKEFDVYLDATIELNNIFKIDTTNELGTKKITAIVLDKHIKKQKKIVKSNWELKNLTPSQIKYAAEDASVALDIFNQLLLKHQYTIHLMPKWFQFKHLKKEEYRPYKEEPFNQIMLELDKKTKNH